MVVKFRKFGFHVEEAKKGLSLRKRKCKHSRAHKISFGGKFCPSCKTNIVQPKVLDGWKHDRKGQAFHRNGESVNERALIKKIGMRIVDSKEGTQILNDILEERLKKRND